MKHFQILILLILFNSSCVSIPKEAVTLSTTIGERIIVTQIAHENLIQDYFQKSKTEIDQFLQEKWIPVFLETFVVDSKIMKILDKPKVLSDEDETKIMESLNKNESFSGQQLANIVLAINDGLGNSERGAIILDFSQNAVKQINLQRTEMMNVITEREKIVLKELRANYNELIALQNMLTAHVSSAHKVVDSQNEILQKIGLLDNRNQIINDVLKTNKTYSKILNEGSNAIETAKKFLITG